MTRYDTLVNVLDHIRSEAPEAMKRYHPSDDKVDEVNHARARAFVHLFLKARFGITDFVERETNITDDPQDGGIDGYFIDEEHKRIYLVQSKFRTTEANFSSREILLSDLLQMETSRIVDGYEVDERGNPYNDKIRRMVSKIKGIGDIGRWQYEVVILANLSSNIIPSQLRRLSDGFPTTVYNYERVYRELVFPVVQGTYYNPKELSIILSLTNTSSQSARVTYGVTTARHKCDITLVFVPTIEIARALFKYRNAILKFNPRSFLELKNNEVNRDISRSITDLSTNEFALYNNGITMLSYGTDFSERIGQKDRAQLIVTQPQIINGGQTAFTLSRLYEDVLARKHDLKIFDGKEVLLKVITLHPEDPNSEADHLELIESISKATNQQSQVNEADRRSNDQIQIQLQRYLFDRHGLFYERKRGEYGDGIRDGYIHRTQLVDREVFMRVCKACDMEPTSARRMSLDQLFERTQFDKTLTDPNRFGEYYFAYRCYLRVIQTKKVCARNKSDKFGFALYGNGLQFGAYAVVAACRFLTKGIDFESATEDIVGGVLERWRSFEEYAIEQEHNKEYFRTLEESEAGQQRQDLNFNNYYKGRTLDADLDGFFGGRP